MMGTARLAAVVLLAGVLVGCGAKKAPPQAPPPVSVSLPLARQIVDWDEFVGRFEAIQTVQKLSYLLRADDYAAADVSVHPPFTDVRYS